MHALTVRKKQQLEKTRVPESRKSLTRGRTAQFVLNMHLY